jgi:hypothetical protein
MVEAVTGNFDVLAVREQDFESSKVYLSARDGEEDGNGSPEMKKNESNECEAKKHKLTNNDRMDPSEDDVRGPKSGGKVRINTEGAWTLRSIRLASSGNKEKDPEPRV